eukprot:CAMPEP_0115031638 /NCGR_PEP_ID=MMETSP0216-20121206/38659_1 /TAXON_ID=223996 /ORGANISM="Protocruzia adherens, Strain Boccale" /LENGTH=142 /DNA_ID=CAMNT_0002409339 /DNA_START=608 /DNA_END=1036 /DNA_ORIENTATION=+
MAQLNEMARKQNDRRCVSSARSSRDVITWGKHDVNSSFSSYQDDYAYFRMSDQQLVKPQSREESSFAIGLTPDPANMTKFTHRFDEMTAVKPGVSISFVEDAKSSRTGGSKIFDEEFMSGLGRPRIGGAQYLLKSRRSTSRR